MSWRKRARKRVRRIWSSVKGGYRRIRQRFGRKPKATYCLPHSHFRMKMKGGSRCACVGHTPAGTRVPMFQSADLCKRNSKVMTWKQARGRW